MAITSPRFPIQRLKNLFWHLPKSIFYNIRYGYPSKKLTLIGITGTDGKTTTASLVHKVLDKAGIKAGLITTLGAQIGDTSIDTGLHMTSPDSSLVQKILKRMVDEGMTHVVIEITAHALDQYRYHGCHFAVSAITNTSHEHLDDFSSMQSYILAKAKLFTLSDVAVLNKDDDSYKQISSITSAPIKSFSVKKASDYQAKDIKFTDKYLQFRVNKSLFVTDSLFEYQIYNILAAYGIIKSLKIDDKYLFETIEKFPEVKGRREEVPNNFKFKTIVDFAHTPAALKSTLSSLRVTTKGNLIVIFGATGGRDKSKRPMMGKVVSETANIAILTSDDTRKENVNDINSQIASGIDKKYSLLDHEGVETTSDIQKTIDLAKKGFIYFSIPNRQDAFNFAVKLAQADDTVIACGKGHETSILLGSTEYPWSESEAFRTAFRFRKMD